MAFIYVGSPYWHRRAVVRAARVRNVARFVAAWQKTPERKTLYSPIVHSQALLGVCPEMGEKWADWERHDLEMLEAADALWVLMLPGWEQSEGLKAELEAARQARKTVWFWDWEKGLKRWMRRAGV
jgi:hypothetical protein